MDVKGCLCVLILIVASVCPPTVTAKNVQSISQQADDSATMAQLAEKLRQDIDREIRDIRNIERQVLHNLNLVQTKKRQLEIKRNQPIPCLVSLVACY
ncbi:hypothetical protein NP493_53g04027 [Ridgeia piscesae]|uniref:Uncharacterized protein n=1 Tax=Ridgeia piscesae TaxID=27915 RepID=A0AAD9UJ31_RIDPI|nr:hypothetical protein NP493_53g04027 [Ridgeia piscesae]